MRSKFLPSIILLGSMYGTTLIASRFLLGRFDSTTYLAIRLFISSIAFVVFFVTKPQKYKFPKTWSLWKNAGVLGVINTVLGMNIILFGMNYVSGGLASILISMGPAFITIMAYFMLPNEKINRGQLVGIGIAFVGAAVLAFRGESGLGDQVGVVWPGYVAIIFGKILNSYAVIYQRKHMTDYDPFQASSISIFIGAAAAMALAFFRKGFVGISFQGVDIAIILYSALVGTFFAQILNFSIINQYSAARSSLTQYVIPIIASISGVIFLHEVMSGTMVFGMALILVGIALANGDLRSLFIRPWYSHK